MTGFACFHRTFAIAAPLLVTIVSSMLMASLPANADDTELPIGLPGYWKAVMFRGEPISEDIMSLLKIEDAGTVGGNGGCNRIFGPVVSDAGVLRIGPLSVTRKACQPKVLEQEQTFLRILNETRDFKRLPGEKALLLLDSQGVEIARFVEVR
ncbi:META domain-containing protein [Roseibium sp.]|uniref:META domain-containing protein n=1 Tax=Roseibium sp. TaxID=1936156 RepID=UPI003A96F97C